MGEEGKANTDNGLSFKSGMGDSQRCAKTWPPVKQELTRKWDGPRRVGQATQKKTPHPGPNANARKGSRLQGELSPTFAREERIGAGIRMTLSDVQWGMGKRHGSMKEGL